MNNSERNNDCEYKDITGLRCGQLTVEKFVEIRRPGLDMWECRCDCGKVKVFPSGALIHRTVESCGCLLPTKGQEYYRLIGLAKENNANINDVINDRYIFVLEQRHIHKQTLREVGIELGVTPERVRQIETAALRKLRWQLEKASER